MTYTRPFTTDDMDAHELACVAARLIQHNERLAAIMFMIGQFGDKGGPSFPSRGWDDTCATITVNDHVLAWNLRSGHMSLWRMEHHAN